MASGLIKGTYHMNGMVHLCNQKFTSRMASTSISRARSMQIGQFSLHSSESLSNALEKMPGNAMLVSRDAEAAFDHSPTNPAQN